MVCRDALGPDFGVEFDSCKIYEDLYGEFETWWRGAAYIGIVRGCLVVVI